ncbi:hypothetical protein ACA910_002271 [Epithemia clementina (nom. ined.)]
MKRVSSRQRLVSWDAFDATVRKGEEPCGTREDDSSSLSSSTTEYQALLPVLSPCLNTKDNVINYNLSGDEEACYGVEGDLVTMTPSLPNMTDSSSSYPMPLKRKRVVRKVQQPDAVVAPSSPSSSPQGKGEAPKDISQVVANIQHLLAPTVIEPEEHEEAVLSSSSPSTLVTLPDEVQLRICAFLEPRDLRNILRTTHKLYTLLQTDEADLLWKGYLQAQWPHCPAASTQYVSDLPLGSATAVTDFNEEEDDDDDVAASKISDHCSSYRPQELNFNVALQLALGTFPSQVDESLFHLCRWSLSLQRHRRLQRSHDSEKHLAIVEATLPPSSTTSSGQSTRNVKAVQFTGRVGTGDRCVRSNQPWTAPIPLSPAATRTVEPSIIEGIPHLILASQQHAQHQHQGPLSRLFHNHLRNNSGGGGSSSSSSSSASSSTSGAGSPASTRNHRSIISRLRRSRHYAASRNQRFTLQRLDGTSSKVQPKFKQDDTNCIWRPFVVPFCVAENTDPTKYRLYQNLTPRLVQYFEVTILPPPASDDDEGATMRLPLDGNHSNNDLTRDCVAVGISCNEFALHTRMPGWDSYSYGYHGDDGGIFYETGHMLRQYGPRFGAGDVVGCGVDYLRHELFFTLNGRNLGQAWKNLNANGDFYRRSWYPTVGMDTKCLVHCNFGVDEPFHFDLIQYMKEQDHFKVIERELSQTSATDQ